MTTSCTYHNWFRRVTGPLLVALLVLIGTIPADAQQRRTAPKNGRTADGTKRSADTTIRFDDEPIDLAYSTLYDEGSLPSTSKPPVAPPTPLSDQELRAVNPKEKDLEITVPLRGYPEPEDLRGKPRPIYAEALLGLYATGSLKAGYSGKSWPYDYFARVDLQGTNGFIDNAVRTDLEGEIGGGYIIGDDYGIFSGGHMGAALGYRSSSYRLYAVPQAPERSFDGWKGEATGRNNYRDISYDAAGRYRTLNLIDTAGENSESSLEGRLSMGTEWLGLAVKGGVDLRLTNMSGASISYGGINASAAYNTSFLTLKGGVLLDVAANSDKSTEVKIAPLAEVSLFPFYGVSLRGTLSGGIAQNTLENLLTVNPYASASEGIRHEVERLGYGVTLRIEPSEEFGLHLAGARRSYDNYMYFDAPAAGLFSPRYAGAEVTRIDGDMFWNVDRNNEVAAAVRFTEGTYGSSDAVLPYVPKWALNFQYTHTLRSAPVMLSLLGNYIGERSGGTGAEMAAVYLLGLRGAYQLTPILNLTLEFRNILDERYELWEGYRERGIFGAVGASLTL